MFLVAEVVAVLSSILFLRPLQVFKNIVENFKTD